MTSLDGFDKQTRDAILGIEWITGLRPTSYRIPQHSQEWTAEDHLRQVKLGLEYNQPFRGATAATLLVRLNWNKIRAAWSLHE